MQYSMTTGNGVAVNSNGVSLSIKGGPGDRNALEAARDVLRLFVFSADPLLLQNSILSNAAEPYEYQLNVGNITAEKIEFLQTLFSDMPSYVALRETASDASNFGICAGPSLNALSSTGLTRAVDGAALASALVVDPIAKASV